MEKIDIKKPIDSIRAKLLSKTSNPCSAHKKTKPIIIPPVNAVGFE